MPRAGRHHRGVEPAAQRDADPAVGLGLPRAWSRGRSRAGLPHGRSGSWCSTRTGMFQYRAVCMRSCVDLEPRARGHGVDVGQTGRARLDPLGALEHLHRVAVRAGFDRIEGEQRLVLAGEHESAGAIDREVERTVAEPVSPQDQRAPLRLPQRDRHLPGHELQAVGAKQVQELEQQQAVVGRRRRGAPWPADPFGELPAIVQRAVEDQRAVRQGLDLRRAAAHPEIHPARRRPVCPGRPAVRQPRAHRVELFTTGIPEDAVNCSHRSVPVSEGGEDEVRAVRLRALWRERLPASADAAPRRRTR